MKLFFCQKLSSKSSTDLQAQQIASESHITASLRVLHRICADLIVVADAVGTCVVVDTLGEIPSVVTSQRHTTVAG